MEKTMFCQMCKKQVPATEIKYMPKGKDSSTALCLGCIEKYREDIRKKKEKLEIEKSAPKKMIKFTCERCSYKFEFDPKGRKALRCPCCGKDDKIFQDKKFDIGNMIGRA